MFRLSPWLYMLLLPVVFFGGCVASIPPIAAVAERFWIKPVTEQDLDSFPVLVRTPEGKFTISPLAGVPADHVIVKSGFDEAAINQDLNASVGSQGRYRYFQVLNQTPVETTLSLEVPTLHDSKTQSWYAIREGQLLPQKRMSFGPGFAFVLIPWTVLAGLAAVGLFVAILRWARPSTA